MPMMTQVSWLWPIL